MSPNSSKKVLPQCGHGNKALSLYTVNAARFWASISVRKFLRFCHFWLSQSCSKFFGGWSDFYHVLVSMPLSSHNLHTVSNDFKLFHIGDNKYSIPKHEASTYFFSVKTNVHLWHVFPFERRQKKILNT